MAETAILHIELTSNCSDTQLDANVKATLERGFQKLEPQPVRDVPLIICGSGPSLDDYFPAVRELYPHAKVMALNGAYGHLIEKFGVVADYYAQLDARECNARFVHPLRHTTTVLLASQVHPLVFEQCPPRQTWVFHLNTPTTKRHFPDAGLYFGSGGGTIGSTAIALGAVAGYRTIGLLGFDSSYKNGRSHAPDQPENAKDKTLPVYVGDREYTTTPAMAKQVEQFRRYLIGLTEIVPALDVRLFGEGLFYDYLLTGQSVTRTRESEAARYTELYEDGPEHYGMPPFRAETIKGVLAGVPRGSMLDVSTGRGETLTIARNLGHGPVYGTEAQDCLLGPDVEKALLPTLPFPDAAYDTVTCFEVIEHLLPEDVLPALEELARVAKERVIVSVCTRADIRGGVNLHLSARSEEEWEETLRVAWGDDAKITKLADVSPFGISPVYEYVKP